MTHLELLLADLLMRDAFPCDLGDGIEVIHEVETLEIEMDCDLDDEPHRWFDEAFASSITHPFVRESAPYERIEIQLDKKAFLHATIEEARTLSRGSTLTT